MNDYFKHIKSIYCKDTGEICNGYEMYLKSRHWLMLRNAIITHDTVCAICGEKKPLQLHHKTYKRIGNESANDLLPLCEECHKLVHSTGASEFVKNIGHNKRKRHSKSSRKICKNCRSFAVMKYNGEMKPVCRYFGKPTSRSKRGCEKFCNKRYAHWCRK